MGNTIISTIIENAERSSQYLSSAVAVHMDKSTPAVAVKSFIRSYELSQSGFAQFFMSRRGDFKSKSFTLPANQLVEFLKIRK